MTNLGSALFIDLANRIYLKSMNSYFLKFSCTEYLQNKEKFSSYTFISMQCAMTDL